MSFYPVRNEATAQFRVVDEGYLPLNPVATALCWLAGVEPLPVARMAHLLDLGYRVEVKP